MVNSKRIFIFTNTRADYGVQRWIIKELQNYSNFDSFIIVGGTHLLDQYGYTIKEISKDNIKNIIIIVELFLLSLSIKTNAKLN